MSFNGYYIRIGEQRFQNPAIKDEGYEVNPRIVQVTDTKVLASGKLVVKELEHKPTVITITFPIMTLAQVREYKRAFRGEESREDEMYLTVEWYDPENDTYQVGTFYHTDLKYRFKAMSSGRKMVECEPLELHEY